MVIRCIVLCVLGAAPSIAQNGPATSDPRSVEKEAALGKQLASEFQARTTSLPIPSVQEYVENLGRQLAPELPQTPFHFTFRVITEDPCPPIHEPAALPGGYVFVPAALFMAAKDEAEFAGMLAHSMAHTLQRHKTQQPLLREPIPPAGMQVSFATSCNSAAVPVGYLKLRRSFELEADRLAVAAMANAGFDPNALVRYTGRVQPEVFTIPPAFSPLPVRRDRIANMLLAISKLPSTHYATPAPGDFQSAAEAVRRLLAPPTRSNPPSLERKPPQ